MGRPLERLMVSEGEQAALSALAARRKTAQGLAMRARIVLLSSEGMPNKEVAARLSIDPATVGKWRRGFLIDRMDGLRDEARCGAPRTRTDLRDARDRLLRAHEAAVTTLTTRQADLNELRGRPAIDVSETEAAADLIAAHQRQRGVLDADLARDDAARGNAAIRPFLTAALAA